MIDHRLELGTKIYYTEENNNIFTRKKITSKDANGVEWYRYDEPLRSYNMKEYTVVGRVLKDVEGRVRNIEEHIDVYYLDDGVEVYQYDIDEHDNLSGYFLDKDEALEWIAIHKEESDRLERF